MDMNPTTRIGAYLVGLGIVFAAALGVGNAVGPVGPAADRTQPAVTTDVDHGDMEMDRGAGAGG
jgi:hypothetical protein